MTVRIITRNSVQRYYFYIKYANPSPSGYFVNVKKIKRRRDNMRENCLRKCIVMYRAGHYNA